MSISLFYHAVSLRMQLSLIRDITYISLSSSPCKNTNQSIKSPDPVFHFLIPNKLLHLFSSIAYCNQRVPLGGGGPTDWGLRLSETPNWKTHHHHYQTFPCNPGLDNKSSQGCGTYMFFSENYSENIECDRLPIKVLLHKKV